MDDYQEELLEYQAYELDAPSQTTPPSSNRCAVDYAGTPPV